MRLKSFHANTMTEAMQMVRDTLGDDAVIVATRDMKGGAGVHVTAAMEPSFEITNDGKAAEAFDWLQYDNEEEDGGVAEDITEIMLSHSVPEEVMDHVISCACVMGVEDPQIALVAAIEHLFSFKPLPTQSHEKALMMVGPPGSGKTLLTAKMAARAVMDGLQVGVISTDTVRAGGIEQLKSFTDLLNVNLVHADSIESLQAALDKMEGMDQVLIDTAATNPFNIEHIKYLARLIGVGDIEPILVIPAGSDAEECADMARAFASVNIQAMVPTRLDITKRLGGLLAAAHQGHMSFADACLSPKVAEGLQPLSPKSLTQILMRKKDIGGGKNGSDTNDIMANNSEALGSKTKKRILTKTAQKRTQKQLA